MSGDIYVQLNTQRIAHNNVYDHISAVLMLRKLFIYARRARIHSKSLQK